MDIAALMSSNEWSGDLFQASHDLVPGFQGSKDPFTWNDVARIIAIAEDEFEYRGAIFQLVDGRFAFLWSYDWSEWTYSGTESSVCFAGDQSSLWLFGLDDEQRRILAPAMPAAGPIP